MNTPTEAPFLGEFEARRIQRMVARLLIGKLRPAESITVSGWREGDWACVRWEVAAADRSLVYPIDCRVDVKRQGLRDADAKALLLDFLGHFVGLWCKDRDQPFTGPKWESVEFAGTELWIRGQVRNERAETDATALIVQAEKDG